jgi:hypothetical protein
MLYDKTAGCPIVTLLLSIIGPKLETPCRPPNAAVVCAAATASLLVAASPGESGFCGRAESCLHSCFRILRIWAAFPYKHCFASVSKRNIKSYSVQRNEKTVKLFTVCVATDQVISKTKVFLFWLILDVEGRHPGLIEVNFRSLPEGAEKS